MKYFLLIFIVFSCSGVKQTQTIDDKYLILNEYLKDKKGTSLVKENYFNGSTLRYFGMYEKWHKAFLQDKNNFSNIFFSKNQEWIFSKEDLKYMRANYTEWKVGSSWSKSKIKADVNLIDSKPNKYGMSPNIRVGYPFFDETKTKAMVVVSKTNSPLNSAVHMLLFKKDKTGKWEQVGKLFVSIS
jgi:hypothetical protein